MDNNNEIALLILKSLEGSLTPSERVKLEAWSTKSPGNKMLLEEANDENYLTEDLRHFHPDNWLSTDNRIKASIYSVIQNKSRKSVTHRVHFLRTAWFRYAAAIILIFGIVTYLWYRKTSESFKGTSSVTSIADVTAPGVVRATITLSDGRIINLDSASNGTLALDGSMRIEKLGDGRIIYKGSGNGAMLYNTVSVPRGSRIANLTLSDGTIVYLNTASSIKYPVAFPKNERRVVITGEVYFRSCERSYKKIYCNQREYSN